MDHSVVEGALAALAGAASRELDRDCDALARQYVAEGVEPQFDVASADFASDPYLICADRYWNLRFTEAPTLATAADCAGWLEERVAEDVRITVREKWAMGYAFITRDSVESAGEVADTTRDVISGHDSDCRRAYFAALYHAGEIARDLRFDELYSFLDSSPLAIAAGPHRETALFGALRAFAAFGSRRLTDRHAVDLFERAWQAPERTREAIDVALNGLALGTPFEGQGELLRTRAAEAVREYPRDHMFHLRLSTGEFLCGHYDPALEQVDTALELLPAIGWRGSHQLLLEQFMSQRTAILQGRATARRDAERQERLDHHERTIEDLVGNVRRSLLRSVELVTIFAAVIAFAVGSLQITLNGNLDLKGRAILMAELGGGLLLFALVIVGGSWLITRNLTTERGNDEE